MITVVEQIVTGDYCAPQFSHLIGQHQIHQMFDILTFKLVLVRNVD